MLGVDTGGTYTDVVVLDADTSDVVASAKSVTTRGDLAIGVAGALDGIAADLDPEAVILVSMSTTLATNAVVEGHGSPVLALLAGFDPSMVARSGLDSAFSDVVVECIDGGHDHYGDERGPLDVAAAVALLDRHGDAVDAVAITSAFAVRNADHEERLRALVLEHTDLPVTVSTELADALDAPRRALTTVLNARLLGHVSRLVDALRRCLVERDIDAPLTIVKGDGSLAVADAVARRPIETILSGPAASVVGAGLLSGLDSFVMADVGGTTTDVGAVVAGRPRLVESGALVGGWRTMVRAIDVHTTGLGGDSQVSTDRQEIVLGPSRHVPLALAAKRFPEVVTMLEADLTDHPPRDLAGQFVLWPEGGAGAATPRSRIEQRIVERIGERPERLRDVAVGSVERRALAAMANRGAVQLVGFTPSDAAHVLGMQSTWATAGARRGAELLAWYTAEAVEDFCERVWSESVRRSGIAVLAVAFDGAVEDAASGAIVDAAAGRTGRVGRVEVGLRPIDPIVAVGGPAEILYREVGVRLGAEIVVPDRFAVANAAGAAAGRLRATATIEVSADGPGVYRITGGERVETRSEPGPAIDRARAMAEQRARAALDDLARGLDRIGPVEVELEHERHDDPAGLDDDGLYLLRVRAEAWARPFAPARSA